jgi:uncharacterized protein (TIGR02271 family)
MSHTVIGLFDSRRSAQEALDQLVSRGISRDRIDISNDCSDTSTSGSVNVSRTEDRKEDGITEFFNSLFGSTKQSSAYSDAARSCDSIVTIHAKSTDEARSAAEILDKCGAVDIDERASQYGYTGQASADTDRSRTDHRSSDSTKSIPVIEEQMHVGKRTVEGGGSVRVRSRIVERPVEERLRLREEHVRVERRPVDRKATDADFANFKEGEMEFTERSEQAVVSKEARVVEEINLNKEVTEREEKISDTVRSTKIDIDKTGNRDENRPPMSREERERMERDKKRNL